MKHPNESARQPDALAALRSATASRHQELDSGLVIGAPDASLEDYASHLAMLRAWLAPLQAWLAGFGDGPQCDSRFGQAGRLTLIGPAPVRAGAPSCWRCANTCAVRRRFSKPPRAPARLSTASWRCVKF
jgi:heme oxygenase